MKIIVVMPVKNEEWILEKSLKAASLFADYVIVADQNSTDRTLDICSKFEKVKVIKNKARFHSSNVRKLLLDAARQIEGQNAIFSFDADEIPTAHFLQEDFRQKIRNLPSGSVIEMQWVNLWRSSKQYRSDSSVWSNSFKAFGFIDDRKSDYKNLNVINDHTSRVPTAVLNRVQRFEFPKVMHFQFTSWERMLSKQAYYRVLEYLQRPKGFLTAVKINARYFPSQDERGIKLKEVPEDWILEYKQKEIDLQNFPKENLHWFDMEVLKFFEKYGTDYFKWLGVWGVDWEQKRHLALKKGIKDSSEDRIKDPRPFYIKFYHKHLQSFLIHNGLFYKIYRFSRIMSNNKKIDKDNNSYMAHNNDYKKSGPEWHKQVFKEYEELNVFEKMGFKKVIDENLHVRELHIDIGCGAGWLLRKTAPFFKKVIGIEPSKTAIEIAREITKEYNNIEFINLSAIEALKSIDLKTPCLFTACMVFSHIGDCHVGKILEIINNKAPMGSILYFYEPYDKNIQVSLWYVRRKKWWRENLSNWDLSFSAIKDKGYRKGISGKFVGRPVGQEKQGSSSDIIFDIWWSISGIYYKVRFEVPRKIRELKASIVSKICK